MFVPLMGGSQRDSLTACDCTPRLLKDRSCLLLSPAGPARPQGSFVRLCSCVLLSRRMGTALPRSQAVPAPLCRSGNAPSKALRRLVPPPLLGCPVRPGMIAPPGVHPGEKEMIHRRSRAQRLARSRYSRHGGCLRDREGITAQAGGGRSRLKPLLLHRLASSKFHELSESWVPAQFREFV